MEVLAGVFGTVCIIAGIVFAFGGALGNSMPTVILGWVVMVAGITALCMAMGLTFVYAVVTGAIIPFVAWVGFWKWSFRKKKQVR